MTQERVPDENKTKVCKPEANAADAKLLAADSADLPALNSLQQSIGNRAVQRLLAQRSGDGPFELDDQTAARINSERGGGQPLDSNVQAKMSEATGQDFNDVKVHTGSASHALNAQLSAKAFTTGSDIFFRAGAYDPGSSGGQELLAHELTHIVQQRSGSVGGGGGRMTVNAPGDVYEQEADAVSKTVMTGGAPASSRAEAAVQRQSEKDEEEIQMQPAEDEEETLQRQTDEEEEEEETP